MVGLYLHQIDTTDTQQLDFAWGTSFLLLAPLPAASTDVGMHGKALVVHAYSMNGCKRCCYWCIMYAHKDHFVPGWKHCKIMFCTCLLADFLVPSALLALLVRSALAVVAYLQWCALPIPLPQLMPQLCSSVCARPVTAVLPTPPWAVPPAPSVRPVQSAVTAQAVQQIPAHLVVVAGPPLLLDPQVLLPVCVRLGESSDTASSASRQAGPLMKHAVHSLLTPVAASVKTWVLHRHMSMLAASTLVHTVLQQ
jgi:hypothetical protein